MDYRDEWIDVQSMLEAADDRWERRRQSIQLTMEPRRRGLVDRRVIDGDGGDADLFLIVRDALFPILRQRRLEEAQAVEARQALDRASALIAARYCHTGYVFSWTRGEVTYYLAIRETDRLTRRLDNERSARDESDQRDRLRSRRSAG